MSVENGTYQKLRDDNGVSALVGGRLFAGKLPERPTLPAVVYQVVVTADPAYSMSGANRFRIKRFQFDNYAEKHADAVKVSTAIRWALQSFAGTLDDEDDTVVNGCIVVADMDFPYEPGGGTTGFVHRRLLEVDIQHTESESES